MLRSQDEWRGTARGAAAARHLRVASARGGGGGFGSDDDDAPLIVSSSASGGGAPGPSCSSFIDLASGAPDLELD